LKFYFFFVPSFCRRIADFWIGNRWRWSWYYDPEFEDAFKEFFSEGEVNFPEEDKLWENSQDDWEFSSENTFEEISFDQSFSEKIGSGIEEDIWSKDEEDFPENKDVLKKLWGN
jgi:hypothetical protein